MIMVSSSWSSSRLLSHSRCASDSPSESRTPLEMLGSESTSSPSLGGDPSEMTKDSEAADMTGRGGGERKGAAAALVVYVVSVSLR